MLNGDEWTIVMYFLGENNISNYGGILGTCLKYVVVIMVDARDPSFTDCCNLETHRIEGKETRIVAMHLIVVENVSRTQIVNCCMTTFTYMIKIS